MSRSASGAPRHRSSAAKQRAGLVGTIVAEGRPCGGHQRGVLLEVELLGLDPQHIAGLGRDEQAGIDARSAAGLEQLAQVRDVPVQRRQRRFGRGFAPQQVDQAIGRDDLVGVQQQDRKQRALLAATERQALGVAANLQRTEYAELERTLHRPKLAGS